MMLFRWSIYLSERRKIHSHSGKHFVMLPVFCLFVYKTLQGFQSYICLLPYINVTDSILLSVYILFIQNRSRIGIAGLFDKEMFRVYQN